MPYLSRRASAPSPIASFCLFSFPGLSIIYFHFPQIKIVYTIKYKNILYHKKAQTCPPKRKSGDQRNPEPCPTATSSSKSSSWETRVPIALSRAPPTGLLAWLLPNNFHRTWSDQKPTPFSHWPGWILFWVALPFFFFLQQFKCKTSFVLRWREISGEERIAPPLSATPLTYSMRAYLHAAPLHLSAALFQLADRSRA